MTRTTLLTLFHGSPRPCSIRLPEISFQPVYCSILATLLLCLAIPLSVEAASDRDRDEEPLRIIAFGAHPDDCEINAGGVAAMWAEAGHEFKCVAMTNGDIGHFGMSGGELAIRRMDEVQACADNMGISTHVMDIHDGELMPTLENRRTVTRLIREWQADIVMVHRPYDYHADHRYSGQLVNDAMILVEARFFTPDTPPLERAPILLYYHDGFERPYPFEPSIVVDIDPGADCKWNCLREMPSQFSDTDSWTWGRRSNVPESESERMDIRVGEIQQRYLDQADQYREMLIDLYGEEHGRSVRYAESFQLSEYGRQASLEELMQLMPSFD